MKERIEKAISLLEKKILGFRNSKGVWDGRLSSSALAVAVSSFALWKYDAKSNNGLIKKGLKWLKDNVNEDGGYGDTPECKSNLSTSLLCWSALSIVKNEGEYQLLVQKLERYLIDLMGSLEPAKLSKAILDHYQKDRTFSVPILAMCALAGRLGKNGWKYVPQLPYQLAALPNSFFRWVNLSVVSYALPALISMGLVKHKKSPSKNPLVRWLNNSLESKLLKVLSEKQPDNGGFLEAVPLTGFVLMTLVGAGKKENEVCRKAESFLQSSFREDGSSPIDTSLTTWVTTLAVNALSKNTFNGLPEDEKQKIKEWLFAQQHKEIHPFTKTPPGGWAWIDTKGGVSDGDDTSGALLAIKRLAGDTEQGKSAAEFGFKWLLGIQNKDGGFPTFCKGWGKLPFDASCPDITAHAIRSILLWKNSFDNATQIKLNSALEKSIKYLKKQQQKDGSWLPLWFGNEHDKNHQNPVYGTSLVVYGLTEARKQGVKHLDVMIDKGVAFLKACKSTEGLWGGNTDLPPSIEETSLATRALYGHVDENYLTPAINWLIEKIEEDEIISSPIGLYFASLWYDEKMYPYVFALGALRVMPFT